MSSPALVKLIRRLGLYGPARQLLYTIEYARNFQENLALKRSHPGFVFPPERLLWATAPTTSYRVYLTGKEAAEKYYNIAAGILPEISAVYEWGSGAGAIIRHMPSISPIITAYGSDYDRSLVDWCRSNIPNVEFSLNSLKPPLTFEDGFFDFVYSRSVYTHLPAQLQEQWLREQLRVTKPGGLVLLTVMGDAYKHRMTTDERAEYAATGIVEHQTADAGGPWFTTFNSPRYMEGNLLAGLEIVYRELVPEEECGRAQDKWIVRKSV